MKIYIGPYKKWWGPYRLSELVPFVGEETKDKIAEWLSETWVERFCNYINSKTERKIKIRIDDYDTWGMDHTLALIILPMLKKLKTVKDGCPFVDDEDLPVQMRYNDAEIYYNDNHEIVTPTTQWFSHRWDWVMNEIIWTFEQLLDDDWEQQYVIQKGELDCEEYPEDKGKDCTQIGRAHV